MTTIKLVTKSFLAIIVSFLCIGVAFAQSNYYLTGRVISVDGDPIPFATIQVESKSEDEAAIGGIANELGEFALPTQLAHPLDHYSLKVSSLAMRLWYLKR